MKNCCEEMRVLLNSLKEKSSENGDIKFYEEEESELVAKGSFNIIFRFCPYCGASQQEKSLGVPFLETLQTKVFPKELEAGVSPSCRVMVLEEALADLQKFFKEEAPKFVKSLKK